MARPKRGAAAGSAESPGAGKGGSPRKGAKAPPPSKGKVLKIGAEAVAAAASEASGKQLTLHRARFVEWAPAGVVAMSACADGTLVALARDDGTVEVFDAEGTWTCLWSAPGSPHASLTSLLWCEFSGKGEAAGHGPSRRLFSAGLDGQLNEWDWSTRRPAASADSYGGSVWQIAAEKTIPADADSRRIAAACDDGTVRVFTVEDVTTGGKPGAHYRRSLPAVGTKMLSVAWTPDSDAIVSGTADGAVHLWDANNGRQLLRITAGSGGTRGPKAQLCVWAVAALADGTLVSGDSAGRVQFWDGAHGTLLNAFQQHESDVLALAATPDGEAVFAAGVDPRIALFRRLKAADDDEEGSLTGGGRWIYSGHKNPHTHDVRTLTMASVPGQPDTCLLLSAGNDAQVLAYVADNYMGEHPVRVVKWPQQPKVAVARLPGAAAADDLPLLLCAHQRWVDVWRLAKEGAPAAPRTPPHHRGAAKPEVVPSVEVGVVEGPVHLARVRLAGEAHVLASTISPDGSTLAISSNASTSIFSLAPARDGGEGQALAVQKRAGLDNLPAACALAFAADSRTLLLASPAGSVLLADLEEGAVRSLSACDKEDAPGKKKRKTIAQLAAPDDAELTRAAVELLVVSADGEWAAASRGKALGGQGGGTITLFKLKGGPAEEAVMVTVPLEDVATTPHVTAMAFGPEDGPDGPILVVSTDSNQMHVFDVVTGSVSKWSQAYTKQLPSRFLNMPGHITGITFQPGAGAASMPAIVYTPAAFAYVDFARPPTAAPGSEEAEAAAGGKRKRQRQRPAAGPQADPLSSSLTSTHALTAADNNQGDNFRVTSFDDACLGMAYLTPESAVLVECPWSKVLRSFPAPFFRHRYGT